MRDLESGSLLKSYVNDFRGNACKETIYSGSGDTVKTGRMLGGVEHFDTFTYDYIGNLLTERTAYTASLGGAFTGKYEYDHAWRVTKAYNTENNFITNVYDFSGN